MTCLLTLVSVTVVFGEPSRKEIDGRNARFTDVACQFLSKPSTAFEVPPFTGSTIFEEEDPTVVWAKRKVADVEFAIVIQVATLKTYTYQDKDCVGYGVYLWLPAKSFKVEELEKAVNDAYNEKSRTSVSDSFTVLRAQYSKVNDSISVSMWVGTPSDDETKKNWPMLSKSNAIKLVMNAAIASNKFLLTYKSMMVQSSE